MPVISDTLVMRRLPSVPRLNCTMMLMARAIVCLVSVSDNRTLPIPTIDSTREMASRAVLACTVVIDPSCPVFIADSMSSTSPPRHSPMTMRSGRIRSAFFTRSRARTSPRPSMLGGRVSRRTTCFCCICNSAASSMVTIRSPSGMNDDIAFSIVVLPVPVPPLIKMFNLAFTQAPKKSDHVGRDAADAQHVLEPQRGTTEAPDRHDGSVDGQRRDDRVHARAVRQPRVRHGGRFVHAPPDPGHDAVDDLGQVFVVAKPHRGQFQFSETLDVDRRIRVDQNVRDRLIAQQRLERPQAHHLVQKLFHHQLALVAIERQLGSRQNASQDLPQLVPQLLA